MKMAHLYTFSQNPLLLLAYEPENTHPTAVEYSPQKRQAVEITFGPVRNDRLTPQNLARRQPRYNETEHPDLPGALPNQRRDTRNRR